MQLGSPPRGNESAERDRPVPVGGDTREDSIASERAENNGRTARLNWLGFDPYRIEVDELAVKLSLVFRPHLFHRQDAFAHDAPAIFVRSPVILHLLGVPAGSYAKQHPTVRD